MSQATAEGLVFTEESYLSASVEQQTEIDIEELLKWLDELWLDPDIREAIDEDSWLKFVESVESELE